LTLGFSRLEGRVYSDVSPIDVIENVLTLYGRKLKTLGVTIEKRYETEQQIRGVAGELRQVFSNLIVNAADALANVGDRLLIHVYDSTDWHDFSRKGVRITVLDNGPGVKESDRRHLFEPFFSTKGQKGTGIGLWVSRGIIKNHGGSLRLRSSAVAGRSGALFSVFLPTIAPGSLDEPPIAA
jgi:signal transduction histidine kinase